tara:strand:- start:1266 stop:1595 length:330 start_codon:yes stop_codon:yes gene_type:complete
MLERNKPKNYLKTTIYILTTSWDNEFAQQTMVRIPFATLATAKERYAKACADNPNAMLQKLTVQGTPRGIGLAMYVLGNNKGIGTGEDVFGEYVEHIAFETITEQAGAL